MSDNDFKSMKEQASREEIISALFANMVMQQANMALMFLGKVPNPQTGEHVKDLDMAQLFIDHLEMLEEKTKGNLNAQEQAILKQSLMASRMAFVEASQDGAEAPKPGAAPADAQAKPAADSAADDEARKKFSKKY
jgi:hypothetical protein